MRTAAAAGAGLLLSHFTYLSESVTDRQ